MALTNPQLYMFTKDFAQTQLLNCLTRPIVSYFRYIYDLAEQDAQKEMVRGNKLVEVMFQRRVIAIQSYDERQLKSITKSILTKCKSLDTLLRTIMIANGVIMGAFTRDSSRKKQKLEIPTKVEFIRNILINTGSFFFTDPSIVSNASQSREAVRDGITGTIYSSFPFEDIIGPLVNDRKFYVEANSTTEATEFSGELLDRVHQMDGPEVVEYTQEQLMGQVDDDDDDVDVEEEESVYEDEESVYEESDDDHINVELDAIEEKNPDVDVDVDSDDLGFE